MIELRRVGESLREQDIRRGSKTKHSPFRGRVEGRHTKHGGGELGGPCKSHRNQARGGVLGGGRGEVGVRGS